VCNHCASIVLLSSLYIFPPCGPIIPVAKSKLKKHSI
jgi:hypothetical protein